MCLSLTEIQKTVKSDSSGVKSSRLILLRNHRLYTEEGGCGASVSEMFKAFYSHSELIVINMFDIIKL